MARKWRLILSGVCSAPLNMAIDEAIFKAIIENKVAPTLRLYTWNPPALSIGYFQDAESPLIAEYLEKGYPLVRRPTGGLAVLHEDEMSYSMTGIMARDGFPGNVREAYRKAHESITKALLDLGFEAKLSQEEKPGINDAFCSASWLPYDIILKHKGKIGGSAQRKSSEVLLQHGSISLPEEVDRDYLRDKIAENFGKVLAIKLETQNLTDEEISLSKKLIEGKYGQWKWNYKGRFLFLKRD
jgi:lipoate-protein ligase A